MERIEIHVFVHVGELPVESNPIIIEPQPPSKAGPKRVARPTIDMETSVAQSFWSRNLAADFTKGFLVWYHLQGTWADRESGGMNDSGHLESADAIYGERMRGKFASARGAHISKEKLVNEMIRNGLKIAREKGYDQSAMEQYLETRVQLLAEGYGLNYDTTGQLRALIYQRSIKLAS